MQVAFHIGANCTDGDGLLKSLLKNSDTLMDEGIAVPGPGRYRNLLRTTITSLNGSRPAPATQEMLMDAIVDNDMVDRVVLANDNIICVPNRIFDNGMLYSQAGAKMQTLQALFAGHELSLYMGIRNPATFLQETCKRANVTFMSEYLGPLEPDEIYWSDMIERIKDAVPDVPLTVWCNEDSPLLWEQLIRKVSDVSSTSDVVGGLDLLADLITRDGMRKLMQELQENPPADEIARQTVIADIWEAHQRPDAMVDEVEFSELDADLIEDLTELYEEDLGVIDRMDGVELILPFR